jgi:hypothetical protein
MKIAENIGDRRLLEECIVFLSHVYFLQGDLFKSLTQGLLLYDHKRCIVC